jgi:hypothetical protein
MRGFTVKLTVRTEQGTLYFPHRDYYIKKAADVLTNIELFPCIEPGEQIIAIKLERFGT